MLLSVPLNGKYLQFVQLKKIAMTVAMLAIIDEIDAIIPIVCPMKPHPNGIKHSVKGIHNKLIGEHEPFFKTRSMFNWIASLVVCFF